MNGDDAMNEPLGPPDASAVPRFAGPATFARLPRLDQVPRADVAVLGIPFDSGVSYRPGARFGPEAVRAGSKLPRPYRPALDAAPWSRLQMILHGLVDLDIVGADVVELSPAHDHAQLTALAAANVVYELLGLFALRAR